MSSAHVACELHMSLLFRAGDGFFGFAAPELVSESGESDAVAVLVRGGPGEPLIQPSQLLSS